MPPIPPNRVPISRYRLHVEKWKNGCGAGICETAHKKVFARGTVPCDVLFVGEAPGESEDVLGKPFCGPAGYLMDDLIAEAWARQRSTRTFALYNLVGCIPIGEDGRKLRDGPDHDDVMCCQPRLREFIVEVAKPKLVMCVGKISADYFDPTWKESLKLPPGVGKCDILHPAYILRQSVVQQGLLAQRTVLEIASALNELDLHHGGSNG